jgi:hypothetical protein
MNDYPSEVDEPVYIEAIWFMLVQSAGYDRSLSYVKFLKCFMCQLFFAQGIAVILDELNSGGGH